MPQTRKKARVAIEYEAPVSTDKYRTSLLLYVNYVNWAHAHARRVVSLDLRRSVLV